MKLRVRVNADSVNERLKFLIALLVVAFIVYDLILYPEYEPPRLNAHQHTP